MLRVDSRLEVGDIIGAEMDLPLVMGECAVRIGHSMEVLLPLDCVALTPGCFQEFLCKEFCHGATGLAASGRDDPAHGKGNLLRRAYVRGHLVGRSAYATRLDLDLRHCVSNRVLKYLEAGAVRLVLDTVDGLINYSLGGRALATEHHFVNEPRQLDTAEPGVRSDLALYCPSSSRHLLIPYLDIAGVFWSTLRLLAAVLTAPAFALINTGSVKSSSNNVVAHTRQVLDPATADEYHRVLLQVVALTTDVGRDLHPVRQPYTGNLPKRRVRLLRCLSPDLDAYPSLLRRPVIPDRLVFQRVEYVP